MDRPVEREHIKWLLSSWFSGFLLHRFRPLLLYRWSLWFIHRSIWVDWTHRFDTFQVAIVVDVIRMADWDASLGDCATGSHHVFKRVCVVTGSVDIGIKHFLQFKVFDFERINLLQNMAEDIFLRWFRLRVILCIFFGPIKNGRKLVILHYSKEMLRWAVTLFVGPRQVFLRDTSRTFLALFATCLTKLVALISIIVPRRKASLRHTQLAVELETILLYYFGR